MIKQTDMKILRITAIVLLALVALAAAADKTHVVKKGESIGGIAYQYNISVDELLLHNPQAVTGVRPGMTITVPDKKGSSYSVAPPEPKATPALPVAEEVPAVEETPVAEQTPAEEEFQRPVLPTAPLEIDTIATDFTDYGDYPEMAYDTVDASARTNILVLLPLTGHTSKAENYVDFYRGMVLAANNAKAADGLQVGIFTHEMPADTASIIALASRVAEEDVAAVIVPNNETQISLVSNVAAENGVYVFNFFSVKDTTYVENPYMLQTYINQPLMYGAAIDYLLTEYAGYTPVILNPAKGKKEKEPFVRALRERYEHFGLDVLTVNYEETLAARSLPAGGKYVFIPMSGSREVFNNFYDAMLEYMMEHPLDAAVFGYPDWTAFTGEATDALHVLGAEIYTRFFLDKNDPRLRRLSEEYSHWYGQEMLEVMPSMAALGFDGGTMLIDWIQDSRGHIDEFLDDEQLFEGLQSSFRFGHGNDNAGYVNTSLYFVKFRPDGTTKVIVR